MTASRSIGFPSPAWSVFSFFVLLIISSFCRELPWPDAPETRVNSGPDFPTIYKRFHFVESELTFQVTGRGREFDRVCSDQRWLHDDLLTLTPSAGGGSTTVWLNGTTP